MAFCIFCGAPLKGQAASAPTGPIDNMKTSMSVRPGGPRTCVNCGQADPLNSVFCVFCGARIDGPVAATGAVGGISGAGAAVSAVMESKTTDQRAARWRTTGLVATIVAGMLGAVLGLGMAFFSASREVPTGPAIDLPRHGMVILTGQPHTFFQISRDGRRFTTGKTGINGDAALELAEGTYHVKLVAPDNRVWEKDVTLKEDAPLVLGGGPEGEIFKE
jgi:hypothetical protein